MPLRAIGAHNQPSAVTAGTRVRHATREPGNLHESSPRSSAVRELQSTPASGGWSTGEVDAEDLARAFALGGGARLSDGPVARGKQGVVWRLDTTEGSWAVKVPFRPSSEAEVRSSTAFHEAAHAAGVPTPQVRRTTQGSVFATIDGGQAQGLRVGRPAASRRGSGSRSGRHCRGRHPPRPAPGHRPGPTWTRGPTNPWVPLAGTSWSRSSRSAGAPFAGRLADLRDELVALESWIEPPQALAPATATCGPTTSWARRRVVCASSTGRTAAPADPSHELGYVLFEFARSDPGRARDLVDAYRRAGGPGTVSRRGHFSMLIAQLGHITEMAAADWLEPNVRSPEPCRLGRVDQRGPRRAAHPRAARVPSAGGVIGPGRPPTNGSLRRRGPLTAGRAVVDSW